jgi:hypothetical protein
MGFLSLGGLGWVFCPNGPVGFVKEVASFCFIRSETFENSIDLFLNDRFGFTGLTLLNGFTDADNRNQPIPQRCSGFAVDAVE